MTHFAEQAGRHFLETEVDLGLTFAAMATDAEHDQEKRDRNRHNATAAAEAIERFLPTLAGGPSADLKVITDGLAKLRSSIAAIPT